MTKPQQSRNGENTSDLVAVLVSNIGALHKQAARLSADVGRLHGRIDFIGKLKADMQEFAFCGRRSEYVVADTMSQ
jgi:hypothetical protein